MDSILSPPLPLWASAPIAIAYLVLAFLQCRTIRSGALRFLIFAVTIRFVVAEFHVFTFGASPFGVSYSALATIAVIGVGLLLIRRERLVDPALMPIIIYAVVIALSALINGVPMDAIEVLAKFGYLAIVMLAFVDACKDVGANRTLKMLLLPMSIPFAYQLVSLALNVSKMGESDGSQSFIGGFSHEAGFSVALACGLLVLCLIRDMRLSVRLIGLAIGFAALVLANYRTTIIAMAPLIGMAVFVWLLQSFRPNQRWSLTILMPMLIAGMAAAFILPNQERFSDIATALDPETELIRDPRSFTAEQRSVFSGRAYIWSRYIDSYSRGSPIQQLVGYGPESWSEEFELYAHNTAVSTLYEYGIIGLAALIVLWGWQFWLALRSRHNIAIAGHLSFFILSMSTMPFWIVEGLLFYGILCGFGSYRLSQVTKSKQTHRQRRHSVRPT